ncbi:hypothetical protein QTH97_33270 [Variovorax sp. J22R24]|uniref:hypothetical protein n=1 Tax=Variovorax gracilis TaxID=3053502 RepID=UPI0025763366|nr:hypothetical protein [Variovorax sp. J22R24]MDM0109828.1 hypothetical protein [Variovorax sp. J22R24]
MIVQYKAAAPPDRTDATWEVSWAGEDGGLVVCWLRGLEKAQQEPETADAARRGELPALCWKGGGEAIKARNRLGALHYLATWQGLRGDDLHIRHGGGSATHVYANRHGRFLYQRRGGTG